MKRWRAWAMCLAVLVLGAFIVYRVFLDIPLLTVEGAPLLDWKEGRVVHPEGEEFRQVFSVIYAKNRFVATDWGAVLTSPDGERWERKTLVPEVALKDVIEAGDHLVAVGSKGSVFRSEDGVKWDKVENNLDISIDGIAYGDGIYVGLGSFNRMVVSEDLKNWEVIKMSYAMNEIKYDDRNARFLAMGGFSNGMWTKDGKEWEVFSAERNPSPGSSFRDFSYGNGKFVGTALGPGKNNRGLIYVSNQDGTRWKKVLRLEHIPEGIVYGDQKFVAVGDNMVIVSEDSEKWNKFRIFDASLMEIAYGNGRFVAAGYNRIFYGELP